MSNAASIKPDTRFMGLFIGRSGSGKSAAAYSFPKPMKVFDFDGNIRSGLTRWIEDRDKIDYDYYPPHDKKTFFERVDDDLEALYVMCKTNQNPYKTVVVDSLTNLGADLLLDALTLTGTGTGNIGKKMGAMDIPGPGAYQFQSNGINNVLAYLKSLPIQNVICTAHIVNKWGKRKDENGKVIDPYGASEIVGEQLAITDKLAEMIPTPFDNVLYFEKIDTGSSMKFSFSAQGELAKSSYSELPYGRTDVTGISFYKLLMSRVKLESEKAA